MITAKAKQPATAGQISSARDGALFMAQLGLRVFPLKPNSKLPFVLHECEPRLKPLAGGIHRATADAEEIGRWFDLAPDMNFGVRGDGYLILDVDVKNGKNGLEDLLSLEPLPPTFTVSTPSGGMHVYLKAQLGLSQKKIRDAIDMKTGPGYVVGPGSIFDGVAYSVVDPAPIAQLPEHVDAEIKRAPERRGAQMTAIGEIDTPIAVALGRAFLNSHGGAKQGERNCECFSHAAVLKDYGLSTDTVVELLEEIWSPKCDEALAEEEIRRTVDSAYSTGRYPPGCRNPHEEFGDMAEGLKAIGADEWENASQPKKPDAAPIIAKPFIWKDPAQIPPREFLYARHMVRGFVSATVAPGGLGKSTLVIGEAVAMATGQALLGEPVRKPLRVWYVNLEDPADELDRRIMAACKFYGVSPLALGDRLLVNSGRDTPITIARDDKGGLRVNDAHVGAIIEQIKSKAIDVLIVDPFVASHDVSENDNSKIEAVVRQFMGIAERGNAAIDLVHHVRKNGGAEVTADDARGASALKDKARSVRLLNPMTEQEASQVGIDDEARRSIFRVDLGKANLVKGTGRSKWFQLRNLPLGNSRAGLAGDEIGVATAFELPKIEDAYPVETQRRALEALKMGNWRAHSGADNWGGKPVAEALGLDVDDKAQRQQVNSLIKLWKQRGWLREVERLDDNRKLRPFFEVIGEPSK